MSENGISKKISTFDLKFKDKQNFLTHAACTKSNAWLVPKIREHLITPQITVRRISADIFRTNLRRNDVTLLLLSFCEQTENGVQSDTKIKDKVVTIDTELGADQSSQ